MKRGIKWRDLETVPETERDRFAKGNAVKSSGFVSATVNGRTFTNTVEGRKAYHAALRRQRTGLTIKLNF